MISLINFPKRLVNLLRRLKDGSANLGLSDRPVEVQTTHAKYRFRWVSHELSNKNIGKQIAQDATQLDPDATFVEGSLYLGGFIPQNVPRDRVFVTLESPTVLTQLTNGNYPTRIYDGGRAILPEARGLRRMFETIAREIEAGPDRMELLRIVHELLYLRRKNPDAVIFNEPEQWLRTVWYESDLLFQYLLYRNHYRLFGAFIYSDLDEELADFLQKHGNAVSALTGNSCLLFSFDGRKGHDSQIYLGSEYVAYRSVIEDASRFDKPQTVAALDSLREMEVRMLSELSGINRSILFGQRLGIRAENTPCLALWESLEDKQILVFPLKGTCAESAKIGDALKWLADQIAEVLVQRKEGVMTELKRRTDSFQLRQELKSTEAIKGSVRNFLSENTPPTRERLYVEDIDSFKLTRTISPEHVADALRPNGWLDIPEDQIQRALEAILSAPFHKEDWGGETNDLYSSNLQVNGIRLPTAFLLKGNGLKKREMQIADCGKNGDQVLRLFNSPAYLFIIQYVGNIAEAVISDVQGKVTERRASGKPAWFLIMDGQDTARLLVAYKKNPVGF